MLEKSFVFFYKCLQRNEVLQRLEKSDRFLVVDLIGSYNGNRVKIPGSLTIQYPELIDRRKELRTYKEVILYTSNKMCNAARKRAVGLQLAGFDNVLVYDAGLDDWIEHGLPVEEY
jgi:rhodanese-related sulfurtransferase